MKQLEAVLKEIGWERYEAKAYCTLVEHGSTKTTDLSFKSNVPSGRIYSIALKLENKGAVKKVGNRPKKYDAQNPRFVLEQVQNDLEEKCKTALSSAEQAWEIRNEKIEDEEKIWQTAGISGIFNEIRRLLEANHTSVLMSISNIEWLKSKDINRLRKILDKKGALKVLTLINSNKTIQHQMTKAGIDIKVLDEQPMDFCIFDHKIVVWITGNYEAASIIVDENMANLLEKEFDENFKKGSKPMGDIIVN